MSPYYGQPDFSPLQGRASGAPEGLDLVSLADVLRNAFVCPPHSIYADVKLATFGFSPGEDLHAGAEFRPEGLLRAAEGEARAGDAGAWTEAYHQRLCEAVGRACAGLRTPWMLQSAGKDSTSLAIAAAEVRPETVCITYLGGREEDEVESARGIAKRLGLRHEALVCDPGRAYERYVSLAPRMPLLTADFALLSYADLLTQVSLGGGDGVVDGLGSDAYFGAPASWKQRLLWLLSRELPLPGALLDAPWAARDFKVSYALATLQMSPLERLFPGSRFSDAEVDALLGRELSAASRRRLGAFQRAMAEAGSLDARRTLSIVVAESAAAFAKGLYTASALSMRVAYPFCDAPLREWVLGQVPAHLRVDPKTRANKVLVREHIAQRFGQLPYVASKGSFRFDVRGLAAQRFEQVHAMAGELRELLPGATGWLERNRPLLGNKYHASKFYLLAVVLPWLRGRAPRS
jgi:asparagine synthetase B (glutamine-hydrolysing)